MFSGMVKLNTTFAMLEEI